MFESKVPGSPIWAYRAALQEYEARRPSRRHPAELVKRLPNIFLAIQENAEMVVLEDQSVEAWLYVDEFDDVRVGDAVTIVRGKEVAGQGRVKALLAPRDLEPNNRASRYRVSVALNGLATALPVEGDLLAQLHQILRAVRFKHWGIVRRFPAGVHTAGGIVPDREAALQLLKDLRQLAVDRGCCNN